MKLLGIFYNILYRTAKGIVIIRRNILIEENQDCMQLKIQQFQNYFLGEYCE